MVTHDCFMRVRAHGFKGHFGWHTYVAFGGRVLEITDLETLHMQGASHIRKLTDRSLHYAERGLYVSMRPPGQLWFDNKPQVLVGYEADNVLDLALKYPYKEHKFNVLSRNCATFTGWLSKQLSISLPYMIGAQRGA